MVEIDKKEQQCIDNYMIKNYADLITLNTQMQGISDKIDKYITPDIIIFTRN